MRDPQALLDRILALHAQMRDEIVAATERRSAESMAAVDRDGAGDTIYAIDTIGEAAVERFAEALAPDLTFVMVAEGLPDGRARAQSPRRRAAQRASAREACR